MAEASIIMLHQQRGRRQRQCEGVDNNDGGRTDFADAELAEDARDVAAAAVARDLARDLEADEKEEASLAPPAGCRDASRRAAATSHPLGAPLPLVR